MVEVPIVVGSTRLSGNGIPSLLRVAEICTSTLEDIERFTKSTFDKIRGMPNLFVETGAPGLNTSLAKRVITEEGLASLMDYATQREHMILQLDPEQIGMYIDFAKKKWVPILKEYIFSITGIPGAMPDPLILNQEGLTAAFKWISSNSRFTDIERQLAKIFYADMCLDYLYRLYLPDDPNDTVQHNDPQPPHADTSYVG